MKDSLEEAAERFANNFTKDENKFTIEDFIAGAKWQMERSYSEEDMLQSFLAGIKCESKNGKNFEQFIKQFKNK